MKEIFEIIFVGIRERINSRYLSYLTIFLIIKNIGFFIILFSDDIGPNYKIELINDILKNLYSDCNWLIAIVFPIILVMVVDYASLLLDFSTNLAYRKRIFYKTKRNSYLEESKHLDEKFRKFQLENELKKEDPLNINIILSNTPFEELDKVYSNELTKFNIDTIRDTIPYIVRALDTIEFYDPDLKTYHTRLKVLLPKVLDQVMRIKTVTPSESYYNLANANPLLQDIRDIADIMNNLKRIKNAKKSI